MASRKVPASTQEARLLCRPLLGSPASISSWVPMILIMSQMTLNLIITKPADCYPAMIHAQGPAPLIVVASGKDSSFTNGGSYPSEVARLWGDMAALEENLITKSIERDNNEVNRTSFLSSNVSLLQPTGLSSLVNSSQLQHVGDDDPLIISINIANILIFVTGFCGNSLVILVILKFTRIETVTDIYILNLAFADFMFLFGLVFLILTMFIDHWVFGNIMCKLYMASTSLNQFASSLLLVVMSFDRFLAVCHPIYAQRFRRLRRAKVICLCIWIMCLILMTPIFVFARTNTYPLTNENTTCAIIWPEYKSFNCEIAFTLYSFAIGFAFPLLLIAAFYMCVIRKLRIAASGPLNMGSSRRSRSRESTNKRIEHLVIGIICTYTICWLPYWISQLVVSFNTTFGKEPTKEPFQAFYPFVLIATCLSYTNSALNPILYAFLSDNFKRRCSDVFRSITSINWCGHRSSPADRHSTIATALCEPSEINHNNTNNMNAHHNNNKHSLDKQYARPESRQTVVMNESVQLVTSPTQLCSTILTTGSATLNNTDCHNGSAMDGYEQVAPIENCETSAATIGRCGSSCEQDVGRPPEVRQHSLDANAAPSNDPATLGMESILQANEQSLIKDEPTNPPVYQSVANIEDYDIVEATGRLSNTDSYDESSHLDCTAMAGTKILAMLGMDWMPDDSGQVFSEDPEHIPGAPNACCDQGASNPVASVRKISARSPERSNHRNKSKLEGAVCAADVIVIQLGQTGSNEIAGCELMTTLLQVDPRFKFNHKYPCQDSV